MLVVKNYTFTPGVSGQGTIVVPYSLDLEDFGKVINVTRNAVLYDPEEGKGGAILSSSGGSTILTLEQNTSYCQSNDKLQITIYQSDSSSGPSSDVFVTNSPLSPVPVEVENFPESFEVSNDEGNPLPVVGTLSISEYPFGSADSFGRLRVSNPFTLFDSSHHHFDNGSWATFQESGGSANFSSSEGSVLMTVGTSSTSKVLRETLKTFPYQPGKSLLILNSFVFNTPKENLVQRVGPFGEKNGFFLEMGDDLSSLCFVKRSFVSGSLIETRISRLGGVFGPSDTGWNVDPMNGSGPSEVMLNPTKSQILFIDIEWLGVGQVRLGFIIDGKFILCHTFDHANYITSTYITSATLPVRYEIRNSGITASSSTLKQICSTVLSEGGFELRGPQSSVGTPITSPVSLTLAGTLYPVVAVRLKSSCLDSVVSVDAISLLGSGNNETYAWALVKNPELSGGSWVSAGDNSPVEYNITATGLSGGAKFAAGYFSASNQGSPTIDISGNDFVTYQLERNSFTSTTYPVCLAVSGAGASQVVFGSIDWKEVSR